MPLASARSTLFATMLITLLGTAGIALPYPVLAPYFLDGQANSLTHFMGVHPKILLGVIIALYPLGILIGSMFLGALSDRLGRKKVMLTTLSAAAIGYLLTGLAVYIESFPLFAAARLLTGVFEGNIAIARAMAVDLHPTIDRTRSLSLIYAATYAGWLLGPLAGGYLMPYGVSVVFIAAAFAVMLGAVCVAVVIKPASPTVSRDKLPLWQSIKQDNSLSLLKFTALRRMIFYHFIYALGLNSFYEFYPLWMVEKFSSSSADIAWGTVATTFSMIITSAGLTVTVQKRVGSERAIVTGGVLLAFCLTLFPLTPVAWLYVAFAFTGAVIATVNGIFPSLMSERFGHHGEGKVMGLLTTNFCFANVISALLGSWIALLGSTWTLVTGGVLCGFSAAWFYWISYHSNQADTKSAGTTHA